MSIFRRRPGEATAVPADPSCEEVGRVLQAYVDGELGPEHAERVAAHLADCERCEIQREIVVAVIRSIRRQRPDLDVAVLDRLAAFVGGLDPRP
jgi:anti-sigma factor ChrR (cupin superfamily)